MTFYGAQKKGVSQASLQHIQGMVGHAAVYKDNDGHDKGNAQRADRRGWMRSVEHAM